jgi:hypothetical protein
VDLADHPVGRPLHDLLFEPVDPLAVALEDREVGIDQGVDQRVGEVVDPLASHPAVGVAEAATHGIETLARTLAEGDHEGVAEHDRELLRDQPPPETWQTQHHEQVTLVDVDLGPLHDLDDVLKGQRMQAITLADLPDRVDVAQALDGDPHVPDAARPRMDLRHVLAWVLDQMVRIVSGETQAGRAGIGARRQAARRLAGCRPVLLSTASMLQHGRSTCRAPRSSHRAAPNTKRATQAIGRPGHHGRRASSD